MTSRRDEVMAMREELTAIAHAHGALSLAMFGSVARGDDHEASDVDFLVEFKEGSSLFDLMQVEEALAARLGVSVDVVSVGGLTPRDDAIRAEAVRL
jgi:predicted nucleotidyltransferase